MSTNKENLTLTFDFDFDTHTYFDISIYCYLATGTESQIRSKVTKEEFKKHIFLDK